MANAKEVADLKAEWQAAREKEEELLQQWKDAADNSEEFARLGVLLNKATDDVEYACRDWQRAKREPTPEEEMEGEAYADWDF